MHLGIKESAHAFLQSGEDMWKQAVTHPSPARDVNNVYDSGCGRKKRMDAKTVIYAERSASNVITNKLY